MGLISILSGALTGKFNYVSALAYVFSSAVIIFLVLPFHEFAHAFAAHKLGDDTAKWQGRMSLNPMRHIDWIGAALIMAVGFGWAKPVPVNMYRFKNPKKGMAVTALAGPACNFLLALLFLFLYGLLYYPLYVHGGAVAETVLQLVYTTAYLSLALAVFNLIPIPPLDGSKVLFSFIPDESYFKLMRYERYGMILLLVLVSTKILGGPLSTATSWLFDKLSVFAELGFRLVTHFV